MPGVVAAVAVPEEAHCLRCNYPLRELSEHRCPECGQAFDPAISSTMNLGAPLGAIARWVLGPVRWFPLLLVVGLPTVGLLLLATEPTFYYMAWFFLLIVWAGLLGVTFGVRAALRTIVARAHRQPKPSGLLQERLGRRLCWFLAISAVAILLKLPLYARFWISKPWLNDIAKTYQNDPSVPEYGSGAAPTVFSPRWAGLYRIDDVCRIPGGIMLLVDNSADGFAYVPNGTVRGHYNEGNDGYLGAEWWWFAQD